MAEDNSFISNVSSGDFDKALEGGLHAVRHDAQELTEDQQTQARTNINALGRDELPTAVDDALAKAKESGEFDGPAGPQGPAYELTEADKQEIVDATLAALPIYAGEVETA